MPARSVADPDALRIAYETGRVNSATGAADIPEIDNRTGAQMDDTGFHPAFHSFTYRARLDRSNGDHDNQVIWLSRTGGDGAEPVRRHAPLAGHAARSRPRACFMAGGVRGDLTCNGTWTVTTATRGSRRACRTRSTSSSASSSRSRGRTTR